MHPHTELLRAGCRLACLKVSGQSFWEADRATGAPAWIRRKGKKRENRKNGKREEREQERGGKVNEGRKKLEER